MQAELSASAFWQFSCALYEQPHVQETLLQLQNEQGKNVNLCLLLCYLDTLALQLPDAALARLESVCQAFDSRYLIPQRTIRKQLKQALASHHLYAKAKAALLSAELQLEQLQQALLIETLADLHFETWAQSNLFGYAPELVDLQT
ncbi:TIGR02444 family protein [Pseudoalteromonas fenneropenaei]|uniref:TIGR02444 family protein n=1 Tax=Pseudoalteromonas fenneropenaei TaxID=1737459 RepID=A0ABV7CL49_9GAMM